MAVHAQQAFFNLSRAAAIGALLLFTIALCSEAARAFGYTDTSPRVVRTGFLLFTVLAIGAAVMEHYMTATRELRDLNSELESRLAEKSERITAICAGIDEAQREWVLVSERQRILSDMHDGVGASLLGLLRYVQSGPTDRVGIEKRVQEALQELRIAVDCLQGRGDDLASALGSLRHRLDDMVRPSGTSLVWDVEELPGAGTLTPSGVFALQRAVLEAVANSLKHANARHIRLTARAGSNCFEIRIEDDGSGFDSERTACGLGLASMRSRALRIGARLAVHSALGKGTAVVFTIPRSPRMSTAAHARQRLMSHERGISRRAGTPHNQARPSDREEEFCNP